MHHRICPRKEKDVSGLGVLNQHWIEVMHRTPRCAHRNPAECAPFGPPINGE